MADANLNAAAGDIPVAAETSGAPVLDADKRAPASVTSDKQRDLYAAANDLRRHIKEVAETGDKLRHLAAVLMHTESVSSEVVANATLAYRHLEDASMRLGKVLQALDGGVSVYDKATTVGA